MNNERVRIVFIAQRIIVRDKIFEILDLPIDINEARVGYVFEYNISHFPDTYIWEIVNGTFDSILNIYTIDAKLLEIRSDAKQLNFNKQYFGKLNGK